MKKLYGKQQESKKTTQKQQSNLRNNLNKFNREAKENINDYDRC